MRRGLPPLDLRPRWSWLLFLLDVGLLYAGFQAAGKYTVESKERVLMAEHQEAERKATEVIAREAAQADSVVAAQREVLLSAQRDSVRLDAELKAMRASLEQANEQYAVDSDETFRLSDTIYDLKREADTAVQDVASYDAEIRGREEEISRASSQADDSGSKLDATRQDLNRAEGDLNDAHKEVRYEPRSILPANAGLLLKHEIRDGGDLTGVEYQHVLVNRPQLDLGLAVGLGLGSGSVESEKQLGLLFSRPLVHRRLGLDLTAGYSQLTDATGEDDNGAFGSAGLRLSPWYQERFHFGLGARADKDGVQPYIGVALGRR